MIGDWTRDALAGLMKTTFRLHHGRWGLLDLELIDVSGLTETPRQRTFSILFRGPLERPFSQGTYRIEHSDLGTVDLFLVPVGREGDGMRYEAVFNNLVE